MAAPRFFKAASDLRRWLEKHHAHETELVVGFYKKDSGRRSVTYAEALDQALCFGWIDGVRRRIDDESYSTRFTPRRKGSIWSLINIRRVAELEEQGLMTAAGLAVFAQRTKARSGVYSHENRAIPLDAAFERELRANRKAWVFFTGQPPSYRRVAAFWVMSARREDTRLRRLATLIEDSAHGRRVKPLRRPGRD
jgi:uncharacterized protein YdeI (YjbR/CyaY-like superfamily)